MNVYEMIAFIAYFVLVIGVGIYFFFKSKGNAGAVSYTHLDVYKRQSKYYKVTYPTARKKAGTYTVKIKFSGRYKGTVSKKYRICLLYTSRCV